MRTFALVILSSAGLFAQTAAPVNLDFESGVLGQVPSGWGMAGAGFQAALVNQNCLQGQRCAMLSGPPSSASTAFGDLYQIVAANAYLSRQIKFRAAVRVQGGADTRGRLWFRVDRPDGTVSFIQNSPDITSSQWNYYEIDADIAPDSKQIVFGFLNWGSGNVWVDDASFVVSATDPREPPRPLSATGLANLTAFAKVLGYVRHFHPSDQAAQTNWEAFAIQGVRTIENAATPQDLASQLQSLFAPIAPTVRVFANTSSPDMPPELFPPFVAGTQIIRWNNFGVGLGNSTNIYHSERQQSPMQGGQLPAGFQNPAQPYNADIGRGLSVMVPLSLYMDAQGTLPHQSLVPSTAYGTVNDRATRLAGVMIAWNVLQHFYPYFDVAQTDWPAALSNALTTAATDTGTDDYQRTLERLIAALKDGHGLVSGPQTIYAAPLMWDWVENQLVVTYIKDDQRQGVQRGDRVLTIDGKTVEDAMAYWQQLVSGATPQWILWRTLESLSYCDSQSRSMQLEIEPYASPGSRRTVQFTCGTDLSWGEPRGNTVQTLESGIVYIDLNSLTDAIWSQTLPSLTSASGIIFDLRGYPQSNAYLDYLSQSHLNSAQWWIPTPAKPDQVGFTFQQSASWDLPPYQPYLTARRVFLTDNRAISYAESVMGIVENYKLAEIVGSTTAGTNGNVNPFTILGSFTLQWTGMKVLKNDGSQHHGVGIHPTIPASRTRQGIAQGTDEVLARGLAVVKGPQSGPTPVITAVVNAASFASGPVAPGETVTIFGTSLGPSQLAQTSFDGEGYLGTYAGETRVFFDNIQAPLVYASSNQVSAIVPYKVAGNTNVRVEYQLRSSSGVSVTVSASAPGIYGYAGKTQAVIVNQDGSYNSAANPAARGEIITLYATGEGQTAPGGIDGKLPAGNWPVPMGNLAVAFGGVPGDVQFKGVVSAGLLQVNVRVPAAALAGSAVPLTLTIGTASNTAGPTVALK